MTEVLGRELSETSRAGALVGALRARWPLDIVSLEPIKVRENAVYVGHLRSGEKTAVRVHRAGYHSNAALKSEHQWMVALGQSGIVAPHAVASNAGNFFEVLDHPQDPRQVDVFEWIHGRQLGSVEDGVADVNAVSAAYERIGELAARMHNHSGAWKLPAEFTRHAWDAQGLAGEQPFWGRFWELPTLSDAQKAYFLDLRVKLFADLCSLGTDRNHYGLIHADLVPENVLMLDDQVRVIDFDDAGFGWYLFDLATSLYFLRTKPAFAKAREGLIRGYRRVRPLTEEDVARLPLFIAARGMTYLGWLSSRLHEPAARELVVPLVELAERSAREYLRERN